MDELLDVSWSKIMDALNANEAKTQFGNLLLKAPV